MLSRLSAAALALAFVATLDGASAFAQTTAPGPAWGGKNPGQPAAGPQMPQVKGNATFVVCGRPGCPIAIVGQDVWNIDKQQKLPVSVLHNADRGSAAALSDDGKLLVVGKGRERVRPRDGGSPDKIAATDGVDATVWDTQTGAKVCEIPSNQRDMDVDYLAFAGDQFVVIGTHPGGERKSMLEVWDAKTGKLLRRFPCNYNNANGISLSPDGRFAAVADTEDVTIYDLTTGKQATSMPPLPSAPLGAKATPDSIRPDRTPASLVSLESLAFSPDGGELAGAIGPFDRHFFAWNHQAELVNNFSIPYGEITGPHTRPFLQWTPDRTSWIVNQHWLLDRKSQRFLWGFPASSGDYPDTAVIDDKRLFVVHHGVHSGTELVTIPWDKIHKAQNAMANEPANALLKPDDKVSLELKLVNPRGDDKFARQVLTSALSKAFQSGGIQIADGQPTVVSLSVEEAADEPCDIYKRLNPFDLKSEPTGRKATPAKGLLTVTIHARGSDQEMCKIIFDGRSFSEYNDTITDDSLRKAMFTMMAAQLEHATLPYFLSKTDPALMLPLGLSPANKIPANFLTSNHHGNSLIETPAHPDPTPPRRTHPTPPAPPAPPAAPSPVKGI